MIKTLFVARASLILSLSVLTVVRAADLSDLTYDASGASVIITACKTSAQGALTIPSSIEGKPVSTIGASAFFGCHGLTSIDTGDTVTEIGSLAFFGNQGIETLRLGRSVTSIASRAFNSCSALTTVVLNDTLVSIGDSAFERCSKLEAVVIPSSVKSIGKSAFRYCSKLDSVHFEGELPTLGENVFDSIHSLAIITAPPGTNQFPTSLSGVQVFTKVGKISYRTSGETASVVNCDEDATGTQDILLSVNGKAVTRVERNAFERCTQITQINIPEGVTTIDFRAFTACQSLQSLKLPNSLTSIGEEAFDNCSNLKQITFGSGLTQIGNAAFNSSGLTSVSVPDTVTSIGNSTFENCTQLERASIGDRVSFVGNSCFAFCTSLKEVILGERVSRLGWNTFEGCDQLESVFFRGNAPSFVRTGTFSNLASEVTVYVEPDASRFRDTLDGAPVVILGEATPEPPVAVVPPATPSTPSVGSFSIVSLRVDADGNVILDVNGSNSGLTVEHTDSLGTAFQSLNGVMTQGSSELVIPSTLSQTQGSHGFFRVTRTE